VFEPLLELLQGDNDHEKYLAAKALGQIGKDATRAVPALQKALRSTQEEVNSAVAEALQKIAGS
jgi:HEAT repeat protein